MLIDLETMILTHGDCMLLDLQTAYPLHYILTETVYLQTTYWLHCILADACMLLNLQTTYPLHRVLMSTVCSINYKLPTAPHTSGDCTLLDLLLPNYPLNHTFIHQQGCDCNPEPTDTVSFYTLWHKHYIPCATNRVHHLTHEWLCDCVNFKWLTYISSYVSRFGLAVRPTRYHYFVPGWQADGVGSISALVLLYL